MFRLERVTVSHQPEGQVSPMFVFADVLLITRRHTHLDDGGVERVFHASTQSLEPPRAFQRCRFRPTPERFGFERTVRQLEDGEKQHEHQTC